MVEIRKLATILALDVAGYSRAAEQDDAAAASSVRLLRAVITEIVAPFGGRIFSSAGDGFMLEFPVASSGVQAAIALLRASRDGARPLPRIRVGLHLGEVIVEDNGDLLGHGVNVAARLMALAEPGTAIVSDTVRSQVRAASELPFIPQGRVQLDKMSERIQVFSLNPGARTAFTRIVRQRVQRPVMFALAAVAVVAAGLIAWSLMRPSAGAAARPATQRIAFFGFTAANADPVVADIAAAATNETFQALLALRLEAASRADTQGVELPQQRAKAGELGAAYALGGEVRAASGKVSIHMHLEDVATRTTLWERTVSGGAAEKVSLSVLAAGAATEVTRCMAGARSSLPRQDGDLLAQLATACATPFIAYLDAPARWRALAAQAPNSAVVQASLANSLIYHANHSPLTAAERSEVWKEATTAAQRALAIEPDNGIARTVLAYDAMFEGRPLAETGALMDAAIKDSPDDWRRGEMGANRTEFLKGVGRNSENLAAAQAAMNRDPLSPTPYVQLAQGLVFVGRGPEAGRVFEQLNARWPDAWWTMWPTYAVRYRISDIDEVLAAAPPGISEESKMCWRQLAKAFSSGNQSLRRAGVYLAARCGADGRIDASTSDFLRIRLLGDVGEAIAWYGALLDRSLPSTGFLYAGGALLDKNERALRADPRFLPLMKKSGLYQYWLDTGTHPDVCDDPAEKDYDVCASLRAAQPKK